MYVLKMKYKFPNDDDYVVHEIHVSKSKEELEKIAQQKTRCEYSIDSIDKLKDTLVYIKGGIE